MPLNARQQRFVAEYLKEPNGTEAARRAGYSDHTAAEQASRLLRNVQIQAKIVNRQAKLAAEDDMDARWVRERCARIIAYCMEQEPMNAAGALKGLELIGKHNGMFNENAGVAMGLSIHLHLGGFPE